MKKVLLTIFFIAFGCMVFFIYQKIKFDDGKLHVIFCNVGQGDGIFIRTPRGSDIVVDGGPDNAVLSCLWGHMPFWDRTIELMVLSQPACRPSEWFNHNLNAL